MSQSYAIFPYPTPMPRLLRKPSFQAIALLLLCALITLPNLSGRGLTNSEGHRVIPALEMVESGEYLVPTMFGQPYLRKPQLVPWLFAGALSIHNNPDLSPRLVSALAFTLMVLGSWFCARRWLGPAAGFPAGIALALTPLYWSPARAAEIESVHNLTTAIGAWIVIELLVRSPRSKHLLHWSFALTAASLAMILTKGPAGFPIFLGLIFASAILNKSLKPLLKPSILLPVAIAGAIFAWHWNRTLDAAGSDAILQSANAFMFEPGRLLKLAGFIPVSLLTAFPITLALLFPWGKDAAAEAAESEQRTNQLRTAKLIALSIPLALLIMMLTGVSNDRYAQPILTPAALLAGWLLNTNLLPHRRRILRIITLGSPKILAPILCIGVIIYIAYLEPTHRQSSGKLPAQQLASELVSTLKPDHYIIVADAMIEARPETLMYLQSELSTTDHPVNIHWVPKLTPERLANLATVNHTPLLALIRTDQNGNESDNVLMDQVIATGTVHEFEFALVTVQTAP